ncbi:DUF1684 domain-containing protein [Luteimonas sp. A277]
MFAALLLGTTLTVAGCSGDRSEDAKDAVATAAADAAFVTGQEAWRAERRDRLLAPDGWTTLVGLHWIELNAHYIGSSGESGMRLAKGPPRLGMLQQREGRLYFTPERGVELAVDGERLTGRAELHSDRSSTPTLIDFDAGQGQIGVIERGGRRALRVRHLDADSRLRFAGIDYWPVDASWLIEGRFSAHPPGQMLEVASLIGGTERMGNPGVVEFDRDGQVFRLQALDDGADGLLLILADRTSGQGSYGAGRYLDAGAPDANGRVLLDFNRAYNPPCAFTNYATCPLPPLENRLDLAITAGEKAYQAPAG